MKEFFEDLFEFNRQRNLELNVLSLNNEHDVPEKTIQLFSHSLNAHHIWNKRILEVDQQYGVWDIHIMNSWNSLDEKNYMDSLKILRDRDLHEIISFNDSAGNPFGNELKDILFHIINHTNYHRAQIITNLLEAGIQPGRRITSIGRGRSGVRCQVSGVRCQYECRQKHCLVLP